MVTLAERIMGRRQVEAEIKSDPVNITISRRTKVDDGAGGWTWSNPTTLDPQEVTITTAKRRLSDMLQNTELGDVVRAPYVVIARHDADIRRDDEFLWNGDHFKVISTQIKTEVQLTAQIDYLAGAHNG
jgi:hypothetical protein